jgi:hypothetical protein
MTRDTLYLGLLRVLVGVIARSAVTYDILVSQPFICPSASPMSYDTDPLH